MPPLTDFRELACDVLDLDICVFGEAVTWLPKRGGRKQIRGIFDNKFEQVDPDTEEVIASNVFTLGVKLKDLPFPPERGDKAKIRGETYIVVDSQEDGVVGSVLFMHKC